VANQRQSDPRDAPPEARPAAAVRFERKEVEQLIGAQTPKDNDRAGWRDRALVETLYSCGLRAGEAVALNWSDRGATPGQGGQRAVTNDALRSNASRSGSKDNLA
jgi:site-specific recombinase XerD